MFTKNSQKFEIVDIEFCCIFFSNSSIIFGFFGHWVVGSFSSEDEGAVF